MSASNNVLPVPYDVLARILDHLRSDNHTLYYCSLVNRGFADATSRILYRCVSLAPPYRDTLQLGRRDDFAKGQLYSACLSHNVEYVLSFELSGYISGLPAPLNPLASRLQIAIKSWHNLTSIILAPKQYHEDLLVDVLPLLSQLKFLRHVTINNSCTGENNVSALLSIQRLEHLTVQNPSRTVLNILPEWLQKLSNSRFLGFHLKDNCGSVTPGVLKTFLPHLQHIRHFSLGLSYSLTDSDLFSFIQDLPELCSLDFRYYLQLRTPSVFPRLTKLRLLTIRYSPINTADYAARFCKWVRYVAAHAPLEALYLICEEDNNGASVKFDPLMAHLTQKHADTLHVLHMENALVGRNALQSLCSRCTLLEEMSLAVSAHLVTEMPDMLRDLRRLRTIRINVRNTRSGRVLMNVDVRGFFLKGCLSLRCLTMDGVEWEGNWVSGCDGQVQFVIDTKTRGHSQ